MHCGGMIGRSERVSDYETTFFFMDFDFFLWAEVLFLIGLLLMTDDMAERERNCSRV